MKRERSVWYAVGWAVVSGAIVGGGVWWITNQITVNNRSILERAPWPLNTPVPFAVAGGVLAGISVLRSRRRSQALREELRAVAGELGLEYEEGEVVVPPEARPKTPLGAEWSQCQNRLSGTNDGALAQMFDLTTVTKAGKTGRIPPVDGGPVREHRVACVCVLPECLVDQRRSDVAVAGQLQPRCRRPDDPSSRGGVSDSLSGVPTPNGSRH